MGKPMSRQPGRGLHCRTNREVPTGCRSKKTLIGSGGDFSRQEFSRDGTTSPNHQPFRLPHEIFKLGNIFATAACFGDYEHLSCRLERPKSAG
ncbi:hypothetical protein [Sphingosinicella sp. BN140058]|uniref:hypothetical protein n=1 Tax=Sphingosinicella sp. BN140058 TaxID=1892855 RepID=UPI0010124697|nr:hypothetical protein [Sphingosinicella sp. BN140058]QAY78131.1 hypothetical protein ETR14_17565 [Sphingosinicella sp. BN140058]